MEERLAAHSLFAACVLFVVLFGLFHWWKPRFAYLDNGAFRPWGMVRHARDEKTVTSAPVVAVALAVLSYALVARSAAALDASSASMIVVPYLAPPA